MKDYNKYKVSIIVPVYNVEKYLNKCIDSILSQTFEDYELILVDDGSTDSSSQICDEYSRKDNRITVVHKKNGGSSSARNAGLDIAKGKYISFIDSDDYIDNRYIEILYRDIFNNKAEISICENIMFKKYVEKIPESINTNINILSSKNALLNLYGKNRMTYVIVWGKMYKKSLFNNIRFPLNKINEDSFIIYKLYLKSEKIIYNSSKLYFYRQTENSIMNKKFTKKNFDDLEAFEEQINFYKINEYRELEKKSICRYCYHLKEFYIRYKNDANDKEGLNIIRKKHKMIKNYVKDKNYYSDDEKNFINAPWCHEKLIEPYWLLIAIKRKLKII